VGRPLARGWHAATAAVAIASVVVELVLVANGHNPLLSTDAPPAPTRVLRFLSYFTIQSNLLVALTSATLAPGGWLLFGPRPRLREDLLLLALIWPALYVAYTLVHGAVSDWYPYPFVDVARIGSPTALRNGVGVVVLLAGVATGYRLADGRLPATPRF